MIPIRLREQFHLIPGEEYEFYVLEENGRNFLCIDCGTADNPVSLDKAIEIVKKNGLKISSD